MIELRQHEFRRDYEILAEDGHVIGFMWPRGGFWHVRIEPFLTEHYPNYDEAAGAARRLAAEALAVSA